MHRKVTVTFSIDPSEYHRGKDTPQGAIQIVKDILNGRADWPDRRDPLSDITIECGESKRIIESPFPQ